MHCMLILRRFRDERAALRTESVTHQEQKNTCWQTGRAVFFLLYLFSVLLFVPWKSKQQFKDKHTHTQSDAAMGKKKALPLTLSGHDHKTM